MVSRDAQGEYPIASEYPSEYQPKIYIVISAMKTAYYFEAISPPSSSNITNR